jgi:hypothetical protein
MESIAASTVRRMFCSDLRWLAGLSWARVGWTFALAIALCLNSLPAHILEELRRFDVPIATYAQAFFLNLLPQFVVWLVLMLLATTADNLPLRGTARTLAFVLALILGVLALPAEECLVFGDCADFPSLGNFARTDLITVAMWSTVVGIAWSAYRRDAATANELHAVAQDRTRLQRRTLEASLKARQARAEPEFLLDIVNAIAASCEHDADRAERMIDELVSYLRAALPDDRDEASTLGRELRIAEAYLELVSLRTGGQVQGAVEVPAPLHAMQIAPGLLLPLVACVVPHRGVVTADGIDVRIEARSAGEDLRIVIVRRGQAEGAAPSPLALTDLRVRLRDLYGDAASLIVDTASGIDARVVLVLPRTLARAEERNSVLPQHASPPEMPFDPGYQGA